MIKINLLPLDKRKSEKTPLKGAGLMLANAVAGGIFALAVVFSYIQIAMVHAEIDEKQKTLASLQDAVKEHDALKIESEQLDRDLKDLQTVTGARPFEWSEIIDKVWNVIDKHKRVWCDSMEYAEGKTLDGKMKSLDPDTRIQGIKYGLIVKCHVAGLDVKAMTSFRNDLKEEPTLAVLFPSLNWDVQWVKSEQKDSQEKYSLDFEIILMNLGQVKKSAPPPVAPQKEAKP